MYKIKKIKVLSLGYTLALIYLIFGLVLGVFLAIASSNPSLGSSISPELLGLSTIQVVLLYPVAYAAGGFILGVIIAFVYNQISNLTGGISVQLVKDNSKKK